MDPLHELITTLKNEDAHFLILTGNIFDYAYCSQGSYLTLSDFLASVSNSKYPLYATFDLYKGLEVRRGDASALKPTVPQTSSRSNTDIQQMMNQFLSSDGQDSVKTPVAVFKDIDTYLNESEVAERLMFVINYPETLVPGGGTPSREKEILSIILQEWSRGDGISLHHHCIVLMVSDLTALDQRLLEDTAGYTRIIRFSKPDENSRRQLLEREGLATAEAYSVAKVSAGMSLRQLSQTVSRSKSDEESPMTTVDCCKIAKSKIITNTYGDLMEIMEPRFGFDAIGGLEEAIAELDTINQAMKTGKTSLVPQGMLFTGPPGVGKTALAEAYAKEAGSNFVRMRDIRSMFVGESERRMTQFLNALKDLYPVVVFIDEFDQNQSQRGGFNGDSGVSQRLFKKLLEVMSDTSQRGKILWLLASNRPDLIDPAIKRPGRCDISFPFLSPTQSKLDLICKAAFVQHPDMATNIKKWEPYTKLCQGYTGAEMIEVVRRGWVRAQRQGRDVIAPEDMLWACDDYLPPITDRSEIARMNVLAIAECSSKSLQPSNWREVISNFFPQNAKEIVSQLERGNAQTFRDPVPASNLN